MPVYDSKGYEYFRVRNRKEKDKEKEKETRSVTGSSSGRKHRASVGSTSSVSAPADSSSQVSSSTYQNVPLDQLPPLPEESTDGQSSTTSPISRSNSLGSVSTSKTSPFTPAELQPYLESEAGSEVTIRASNSWTNLQAGEEWIGPIPDSDHNSTQHSESHEPAPMPTRPSSIIQTGTSRPVRNVLDVSSQQPPSTPSQDGKSASSMSAPSSLNHIWGPQVPDEFTHRAHQMGNPFLPVHQAPPAIASIPSMEAVPAPYQPLMQLMAPALPVQSQDRGPDPSNEAFPPGDLPSAPSPPLPPHPGLHPPPNALPYYNSHPSQHILIDGTTHLLQRVGSAIPDLCALIHLYQQTCEVVRYRDSEIYELKAQKTAETRRQSDRIEQLQQDLEQVLSKNKAEIEKLTKDLDTLELRHGRLEDDHAKQVKLKNEAMMTMESLNIEREQAAKRHQDSKQTMVEGFAGDLKKIRVDSAAKEQALSERLQATSRIAEATLSARIAEIHRQHEHEIHIVEDRMKQEKRELEECHTKKHCELENMLGIKRKLLDEERREYTQAKTDWDLERDALLHQWGEERKSLMNRYEEQHQVKDYKSKDEMLRSSEVVQSRQASEHQEAMHVPRDDGHDLRKTLKTTQLRLNRVAPNAAAVPDRSEEVKPEPRSIQSDEMPESPNTVRTLQNDDQDIHTSRARSQSRQNTESREAGHVLRKEKERPRVFSTDRTKEQTLEPGPTTATTSSTTKRRS